VGSFVQIAHGAVSVSYGSGTLIAGTGGTLRMFDGQGEVAWTVRNFTGNAGTQIANIFYTGTTATTLDVEASSFTGSAMGGITMPAGTTFRSYYNTFAINPNYSLYNFGTATVTIDSDYNAFTNANQYFNINGTLYPTVAAYKAGTGLDAHSTP
jgi:hypothetical protein